MKKWRLIYCNNAEIRTYLEDGWEPFAVTCEPWYRQGHTDFQHTVWLRKEEVESIEQAISKAKAEVNTPAPTPQQLKNRESAMKRLNVEVSYTDNAKGGYDYKIAVHEVIDLGDVTKEEAFESAALIKEAILKEML